MRETMLGIQSDRVPLTKEQIHRAPQTDAWVSPNYGDGGWHDQPGTHRELSLWTPCGDRIFVRLLPRKELSATITTPQIVNREASSRDGIVLKCGPGRWIPGTWWYVLQTDGTRQWEWIPGYREEMTVRPGDIVTIGRWTDWETWDASYEAKGSNTVICMERDVRGFKRP